MRIRSWTGAEVEVKKVEQKVNWFSPVNDNIPTLEKQVGKHEMI